MNKFNPSIHSPKLLLGALIGTVTIGVVLGTYLYSQSPLEGDVSVRQRLETQVGAYFVYWHDCPKNNCDLSIMPFPKTSYPYKSTSKEWYKQEFKDMERAGLDTIIPVSWGSGHPTFTWFRDSKVLPIMVEALDEIGTKLRLAYFDDTNSVVAEWNLDNGRGYGVPTTDKNAPRMPLDPANYGYFYDRKMKVFFKLVPKSRWATHDGTSIKQGGRPIVMIYDGPRSFDKLTQADEMWPAIRAAFMKDFGVNPFIILEQSWVDTKYNPEGAKLKQVIDGIFVWAGGIDEIPKTHTWKGYTTVSIDAGFACPEGPIYVGCVERPRNKKFLSNTTGRDDLRLTSMYKMEVPGSNLVLVNSWNELWEGTGINRNRSYPKTGGGFLPEDYYIRALSSLTRKGISVTGK